MKRLFAAAMTALLGVTMAGCAMSGEGTSANASGRREPGITGESMNGPRQAAQDIGRRLPGAGVIERTRQQNVDA